MLAIDIGSNTLKVSFIENGAIKNLDFVLNLGLFYENDRLSDDGIKVLENALDNLALRFDLSKAKVVATAIFRKSQNAKEIAQNLYEKYGFRLQILSQIDEAKLTRIGVGYSLKGDFTLVDIGGYSTEISDENNRLLLDIGLLSFYKNYKAQNEPLDEFANSVFAPFLKYLKAFKEPIVLASKTGVFAKSLQDGLKCDEVDDLDYHNIKITRNDLYNLIDFLERNDTATNELYVGKNRDFAVLCGAYFILTMFKNEEFIISAYGLKEGVLFDEKFTQINSAGI